MAIRLGPKIDLTSVVLNLDAANPASYNGVGSTWYDLSGNGNHFTLDGITPPVWTGKSISFNSGSDAGKNQWAFCTNGACGDFGSSSFSIEIVMTLPAQQGGSFMALMRNRDRISATDFASGISIGIVNQATFADSGFTSNSGDWLFNSVNDLPLANQTSYQTYTIQRGIVNTLQFTGSAYRNSIITRSPIMHTKTGDGLINGPNILSLMVPETGVYATASIHTIKMYNRVLSQSEISENYQIYRQYYGF